MALINFCELKYKVPCYSYKCVLRNKKNTKRQEFLGDESHLWIFADALLNDNWPAKYVFFEQPQDLRPF